MAATANLSQVLQSHNFTIPQHGVVTLSGYGINVRVERGHLLLEDGIGDERRKTRLSRVGHGLKRLVVIGADGMVSLSALRWLADQNASFVMLERDGSVLAATGPVRPSDPRLRRAQALAHKSGAALHICRELIRHKLAAQEQVVREKLLDDKTANQISKFRAELNDALSIDKIRVLESRGAAVYWSLWRDLPVMFPKKDLPRIPAHWISFGTRVSPISGSQRLAVNPPNAILNYLYAVLESEARLASATLGLDPGLGVLHVDTPSRDSLASDLMEPVRPIVDSYLLDWITREPLRREWFFEKPNGNCRLMASLTEKLSETAQTWARAVAPYAEFVAQTLWTRKSGSAQERLGTPLTQRHKREAKGQPSLPRIKSAPQPERVCPDCGNLLRRRKHLCAECSLGLTRNIFDTGRKTAQAPRSLAKRSATARMHKQAIKNWRPSDLPVWLTRDVYLTQVQPALASVAKSRIRSALGVSEPYSSDVKTSKRIPHPRHWLALAKLTEVTRSS